MSFTTSVSKFAMASASWEDLTKLFQFFSKELDLSIDSCEFTTMLHSNMPDHPAPVLLFGSHLDHTYPFPPTAETLTENARYWMSTLTEKDKQAHNAVPGGWEEECELGWELFKPDWYSDEYGIQNYQLFCTLALRPCLIEYGK